jgi:type IV secretory pathway TrbL component
MAFADILTFMLEYSTGHTPEVQATQSLMLIAAIILQIPIAMILLSQVLEYKINRILNIIAGVITILFVIGGGSTYLHYLFFALIEVICLLLIIRYSCKWIN